MKSKNRGFTCKFFVFLSVLCTISSCNKSAKNDSQTDYNFYQLKQQGWKSKRVNQYVNDINYTATEVPLQYYLLKNVSGNSSRVDSLYSIHAKERIIEIEFQHTNQVDLLLEDYTGKAYEEAVKYMAFTIERDFTVVTSSNDTIACSGVNFERNFKVAPFKRLLLYFNDIDPSDKIKLIYRDHLFGNGIVKFNFNHTVSKI